VGRVEADQSEVDAPALECIDDSLERIHRPPVDDRRRREVDVHR
jgi:hypothetical protein